MPSARAAPAPAKPGSAKTAQSHPAGPGLCVAPMLGHAFDVQQIGLMVFGNSLDEVAIGPWQIDDLVMRKVGALVGSRFHVRRVNVPQDALAAYEHPGMFGSNEKALVAALHAATPDAGTCQSYLVVNRTGRRYTSTNQLLTGLGVLHQNAIKQVYLVFAVFAVQLYDGRTLEQLKWNVPSNATGLDAAYVSLLGGRGSRGMNRVVDETWWSATPQAAVQNARLREATRAMVEEGLAKSVPGLW